MKEKKKKIPIAFVEKVNRLAKLERDFLLKEQRDITKEELKKKSGYEEDDFEKIYAYYQNGCYQDIKISLTKQDLKTIDSILEDEEKKIIKLFFDPNGNQIRTDKEVGNLLGLTEYKAKMKKLKIIQKLRRKDEKKMRKDWGE